MPRHLAPVRPHWPRLRRGATGHHRAPTDSPALNADERLEVLLPWAAVRDEHVPDTLGSGPGATATRGAR